MRLPRMTMRRWMIAVVVAALNLTADHFLFTYDPDLLLGVALNGLVLQLALCRLVRVGRLKRAFYAGFIVAGMLSAWHFIWIWEYAFRLPFYVDNRMLASSTFWSRFLRACEALLAWPYEFLEDLPHISVVLGRDEIALDWVAFTLLAFLPQILIALGGGLLCLLLVWVIGPARRERKR